MAAPLTFTVREMTLSEGNVRYMVTGSDDNGLYLIEIVCPTRGRARVLADILNDGNPIIVSPR